jgi:hypothetical protein
MNTSLYYADEDLREIEKEIYRLTFSQGNIKLDSQFLLERLFEKGFSFVHYSEKELLRKLIRYLKRYVRETLENLKNKNLDENKILQIRYENFLLLEQALRVSTKDLWFFNTTGVDIAFKCIKDPKISNFLSAILLVKIYPTYEEFKKWFYRFENFTEEEYYEEFYEDEDNSSEEADEEVIEEDKELALQLFIENIERQYMEKYLKKIKIVDDESIMKESYYDRFCYGINKILTEYTDITDEEIREILNRFDADITKALDRELIKVLYEILRYALERIIYEDDYMREKFENESFEDMDKDCKNFEDVESKECQFARILYYWCITVRTKIQRDFKIFSFLDKRVNFTNIERKIIDFIKKELERRKICEKERLNKIRKKIQNKKEE